MIERPGVFIDNTYIYINVNGPVLSFVLALNVTNQRSKGEIQTTQLKVQMCLQLQPNLRLSIISVLRFVTALCECEMFWF